MFLESDIFCTLETESVAKISGLYKVSSSKLILIFELKTATDQLQDTKIHSRLGDKEIILSFQKRRSGHLNNEKDPTFVTFFLPEYLSKQAVKSLAFSNFGEYITVFEGKHKFNRNIRKSKRHVKIFPMGDTVILSRKFTFYDGITRDILFVKKVVLCYKCKTRHIFGKNLHIATHPLENSDFPLTEHCNPPQENQLCEHSVLSG